MLRKLRPGVLISPESLLYALRTIRISVFVLPSATDM